MNKVYVVGLGPGGEEFMTAQARAAMERADVLCGYTVYVDLVKHLYPGKETYVTPMTRELERCRWALETAAAGRTVAHGVQRGRGRVRHGRAAFAACRGIRRRGGGGGAWRHLGALGRGGAGRAADA